MEEGLKTRIILIISILCVILIVSTVSSCGNYRKVNSAYNREMAARLDIEENMSKFTREKKVLEIKSQNANKALQDEKKAHEAAKKALEEEELANRALKEELARVNKLKSILEEDLKEALVADNSKSRK